MIAISCNNINKSFGIDVILKDISFTVNIGDKIGLIGKNGTGKSTLFKILSGQIPYDSGDIFMAKNMNIGYLKQDPDFDENKTIYEECIPIFKNIIDMEKNLRDLELEISKYENHDSPEFKKLINSYSNLLEEFNKNNGYGYKSEIRGVLKGLSFKDEDFNKPIYQLSGGQKSRLNIAKLLLKKPDILLLDEPTNHLDIDAIGWLENFLKNYSGTLMIISHDRYFLDQVVGKIFEIENHSIIGYEGNYTKFVEYKKDLYENQLKKYQQQQKEIERQEEMIRRFKQHGTEKLAKRAKSREKALEKIDIVEKPTLNNYRTRIKFDTDIKSGREVLKVQNLSKSFEDSPLFSNVNFDIYRGERVGLIGPNGIGKTTLFKILLGKLDYNGGNINIGHNVFLGYFDQEQSNLNEDNNLIDEVCNENPKISIPEARNLLASFLFTGDEVFKKVGDLSGGEKSRLSILKLMLSKANFLLLDEPTNHLDLPSKEVLEEALTGYNGTILTISHDRYFLNKVATKILEMSKEGIVEYLGNYDYYVEKKRLLESPEEESSDNIKTKTQLKEERRKEKLKKAKRKKQRLMLKELEAKIAALEDQIAHLELMMCDEDIYSNPDKSREIHEKHESIKTQLENLYEKWEEII
ncbi:MAG: ATP-binding cassette, subfamily er 3 [Candidatus Petromonas sp.]|nr:ATP-binding cassette, subfamily er 3 [Candidatus Petromonas sp.]